MARPCCSIEMEPRTLNQGQLTHAREVAVDLVQKKEPIEARSIFMEGLKPVAAIEGEIKIINKGDSLYHKLVTECEKAPSPRIIGTSCQCSCSCAILESPEQVELKEPVSAPF